MKRTLLIIATLAGIHLVLEAQTHLNGGIGYYGENVTHPGMVKIALGHLMVEII